MTGDELVALLERYQYPTDNEQIFGDSVARVLERRGVQFQREASLGALKVVALDEPAPKPYVRGMVMGVPFESGTPPDSRIDFLIGRVGLELKVKGSSLGVLDQLMRYATSDRIDELVLFTTKVRLCRGIPKELRGKPVKVALFTPALF